MQAVCPNCNGSRGDKVARNRGNSGGVIYSFVCPECDYEWTVSV